MLRSTFRSGRYTLLIGLVLAFQFQMHVSFMIILPRHPFMFHAAAGMKDADLWVCLYDSSKGAVQVLDLWSTLIQYPVKQQPPNDTSLGGTYDVLVCLLIEFSMIFECTEWFNKW